MQAEKIQMRLQYLDMNNDHMQEYCNHGTLVTTDNVCLDRRVCRGRHWSTKWNQGNTVGTIVGYIDDNGLVGNIPRGMLNQAQQGNKGWCIVQWDHKNSSAYPIGAQGIYALSYM